MLTFTACSKNSNDNICGGPGDLTEYFTSIGDLMNRAQGKFKVKDNKVIQQAPTEEKLKDYKPGNKDHFMKLISEKANETNENLLK